MPTADGRFAVTQRLEFELAIPFWGWLFGPPLRGHLSKIGGPAAKPPVWFPPDKMDAHASATLARIGVLAAVLGYAAVILTQTITYAADEFGAAGGEPAVEVGLGEEEHAGHGASARELGRAADKRARRAATPGRAAWGGLLARALLQGNAACPRNP